jgi:hypothetical protein
MQVEEELVEEELDHNRVVLEDLVEEAAEIQQLEEQEIQGLIPLEVVDQEDLLEIIP